MDLALDQQVVFVAGSSRGIGRAIAEALLAEGARVVLTGRDPVSLRETVSALDASGFGAQILAIPGDLTQNSTIADAVSATLRKFGRIDHLVANLGTGTGLPGLDPPEAEWTRLFELNFFAAVRLTQAVLPQFSAQGGTASVLFIASIVALEATPAPLPYSAAKAALVNYAKNLARQLGPQNIRVNSIAPGNILFSGGSWEKRLAEHPEQVRTMLKSEVPVQRFGTPAEIAALAVFLCSKQAGFATGACYVLDGGQTRAV